MTILCWRAAAAAALVAAMASLGTAEAGMIHGSLNFIPVGKVKVTGETNGLGTISKITFPALEVVNGPGAGGGQGDYSIIPLGTKVTVNPLAVPITNVNGAPFPVTAPTVTFGPLNPKTADPFDAVPRFKYTPLLAQVEATGPDKSGASSLSFSSTGFVHDTLGQYLDTPTSFSFSATQSTLTGPINVSFSLVSAAPVPAPAGLVLALTGLPALALVRRLGRPSA